MSEVRVRRWGPGIHIDLPQFARHDSNHVTGLTLSTDEAHALLDGLGAVLDRDVKPPKGPRPSLPPNGGDKP